MGSGPDLARLLRGAHASALLRGLGAVSYPVYVYLSDHGELFVPAFDTTVVSGLAPDRTGRRASCRGRRSGPSVFAPPTEDLMRAIGVQLRGVVDTLRSGRVAARALAIADSRSLVRSMFLASAVRIEILPYLRAGRRLPEIVRPDRLHQARTSPCVALDRLGARRALTSGRERYGVRGGRARALAEGDPLLVAHYRSMLEYQIGPYGELGELLRAEAGGGRADLARYADDIAQVSLAAAPFVSSFVRQSVAEIHPSRVLDVGCGTGVYSKVVLQSDPLAHVEAIDLSEDVIATARDELDRAGYGSRVGLHVGDVRDWAREPSQRFDLVMLLNNIYYFDRTTKR